MVAVVRGERSPATPRSKSAPASARGAPQRARPAARDSRPPAKAAAAPERVGLGPRLALGVAALVIVGGAAAGLVLTHREHVHAAAAAAAPPPPRSNTALGRLLTPLGFRLARVDIQGAPEISKDALLQAAGLAKDTPIIGIGLDEVRQRIVATGWVKDAKVIRLLPDTLIVAVTPRDAVAVWQHAGETKVVDGEGRPISGADPARFADLPLVVGEGAAQEAHMILPLLRQQPKLMAQVDALIRVDNRRWDLRLKDGALIQLPAIGEDNALLTLDRLEQSQKVLSLGFERIDLRDPEAIAVRPRAPAASVSPVTVGASSGSASGGTPAQKTN